MVARGSKYSDEDRREAVVAYCVHGSISATSRTVGIPARTLADWMRTEWWESLTTEVRQETDSTIVAGLTRIAQKALLEAEDRLDNGDVYVFQGEATRAPVKAKDATVIAAVALDKRQLLLNKPTSISGNSSRKLEDLAKQFEEIARQHRAKVVSEQ